MIKKPIPKFQSESEEAEWWDQHREGTAQWMEEAITNGETTTLSHVIEHARERAGITPSVSIHIDPDDITRARSLLGWEAAVPVEEGLKRTIDYFRELFARGEAA